MDSYFYTFCQKRTRNKKNYTNFHRLFLFLNFLFPNVFKTTLQSFKKDFYRNEKKPACSLYSLEIELTLKRRFQQVFSNISLLFPTFNCSKTQQKS